MPKAKEQPKLQVFIGSNALARRLNVSPSTVAGRVACGALTPDGILLTGESQTPAALFQLERVGAIRAALFPSQGPETIG